MNEQNRIRENKFRRAARSRARIFGTRERPRLSVFRSNRTLYVQLIDDEHHHTLLGLSAKALEGVFASNVARAERLGAFLAARAKELSVTRVVFHRGPYRYHGQVRALAEGARRAGLSL